MDIHAPQRILGCYWNTIGWIVVKFGSHTHVASRDCNDFVDPLTFHLEPSSLQNFSLSNTSVYDRITAKLMTLCLEIISIHNTKTLYLLKNQHIRIVISITLRALQWLSTASQRLWQDKFPLRWALRQIPKNLEKWNQNYLHGYKPREGNEKLSFKKKKIYL